MALLPGQASPPQNSYVGKKKSIWKEISTDYGLF